MTMTMTMSTTTYISAHSAEVILSDFRPLKLQSDALQFLNLLLDDLLVNIITFSRSILTDRLKTGLLKTLPTTIGKDALLEAEMELRAYWQRPNAIKPSASQASASENNFSLPIMIELMRLKCEAYSTLNDSDEDAPAENKIQERLRSQGMEPPKSIIVAPAALYLTAILEHILSSVGRVATRDSSKEVAGTHDLFVALCEDDAIYPIFKVLRVYELIESSLKLSSKPRRSKSLSRPERQESRDLQLPDLSSQSRSRPSLESALPGTASGSVVADYHPPRSSLDKGIAIKLFRPSGDRDVTLPPDAVSRLNSSKKSLGPQSDGGIYDNPTLDAEEDNLMQEFDDLMRSGDTMKVSLTPDRLRTMEAARQQQQRATVPRMTRTAISDHSRAPSTSDAQSRSSVSSDMKYHGTRKSSLLHVDSITEDEEPKEIVILGQDVQPRSEVSGPSDARVRSVSTSGITKGIDPRVTGKSPLGVKSPPASSGALGHGPYHDPNLSPSPQRVRKIQRNRESMDIDDIMNGSEEGSESSPDPGDQTSQGRVRLYPVSKAANDLISFLEEGPPPEIQPVRTATVSTVSLTPTTKSAKSGSRLQRMISKLNLTKEDRAPQDSQRSRGVGIGSAPSTPSVSSLRSFGSNNPPPVPIAIKPVPPPIIAAPQPVPISPSPSSRNSLTDDTRSHLTRSDRPRKMSVRKAVPTWEGMVDQGTPAPHSTRAIPSPHPVPSPRLSLSAKDLSNHSHDNHKSPRSESPAATPTSPVLAVVEAHSHSPTHRENGNGRTDQPYPQGIYRPRSSRPNHRSSVNDEQFTSVRRLSGRRPQPSSGMIDRAQGIPATPSLSEALALDMRRLMSQATNADECRLLVDTFLARAGIASPFSPALYSTPSDVEPLERTLVNYFLGTDLDESQLPHTWSAPAEVERRHPPPDLEHSSESNDPHQSITASMDSASAVHVHHIVSAAVAVVS
ncbi:hypothetical protein B0F90DRAFT_1686276 [Multifurca ochricompacta]|uniref:Uncharacterized protein n=1 Tax=Multifurca ochricompacta TaxID=376703 RepID=A0AAD4MDJ5_9AGAM|nr:hypothetical protein B0F90DRAFT_1686276 [Multifurca ochricompacta]